MDIPVAHLEAGPRTFNRKMPEEVNRVLIDHTSSLLFAPTRTSVSNLEREGVREGVHFTGDTMLDSFREYRSVIDSRRAWEDLGLEPKEYHLLTVHREENTDNRHNLARIIDAVSSLDLDVLFPVHPRTQKSLADHGLLGKLKRSKNIRSCDPLGYFTFLNILSQARGVLTDSGGIQKQAFFYEVPCITFWSCQTAWVETLKDGWNRVVDPEKDLRAVPLSDILAERPGKSPDVEAFGSGHASRDVVSIIYDLGESPHRS